jgi:hypothetical protein
VSYTDESTESVRNRTSPTMRDALGLVRRMAVTLTDGAFWQVIGHLLMDGVTREPRTVEPWQGIGFSARPAPGSNAEGVMVNIGGAQNPALVATRDEDLRRKVFPPSRPQEQDNTAMYNTVVVAQCTKTGLFTATTPGGTPHGLALKSELENLRAFVMQQFVVAGHTHVVSGGATTTVAAIVTPVVAPVSAYPGTVVLQGE